MQAKSGRVMQVALLVLVIAVVLGTAGSLAYDRHWSGFWQLVPWFVLAGVGAAAVAALVRPSRLTFRVARVAAALAIVGALAGVWQHFDENYRTAPLDSDYTDRWDAMPAVERVWAVASGSVGHVPVPSAAALAPIGLALGIATVGRARSN